MNKTMIIAWFGLLLVIAAYLSGFFNGKNSSHNRELKKTIEALDEREKIDETIQDLDDIGLCVALGGVPDICAGLLRRLEEAATGE